MDEGWKTSENNMDWVVWLSQPTDTEPKTWKAKDVRMMACAGARLFGQRQTVGRATLPFSLQSFEEVEVGKV